jgi:hypothetical protein
VGLRDLERNKAPKIAPDFDPSTALHPPVHIRICTGGCNAVDGSKDKQEGRFIFSHVPNTWACRFGFFPGAENIVFQINNLEY